jgi:ribosomal protein S18 acetylase RimI-like enzyme
MNEILHDVAAPALVTAIEANQFEFFSWFRRWPQAELHDERTMLWSITDIPFPIFNSVLRARIAPGRVDAVIEEAIARCRSRNVPMLWWVGPATQPADLGSHLKTCGFVHDADLPGMAVDLSTSGGDPALPPGLVILPVTDVETLRRWCEVLAAGFGMPAFVGRAFFGFFSCLGFETDSPLRNYIGLLNGKPVATSTLFLAAGVAGIYDVAAIRDARQKGIGAAMTARGLGDARAMGYRAGILQSSAMGVDVYRKLGFREYCTIGHYLWTSERVDPGRA